MSASNKVPENLNYLSNVSFRLTMEDAPHMTWFCQSANIPGVSIDAIEIFNPTATIPLLVQELVLKSYLFVSSWTNT